ncbi:MAG: hypothetical protein K1X75_00550 [Leptospirales bacterium]|nr:hypothetical protein [Leptospirales bacterium]
MQWQRFMGLTRLCAALAAVIWFAVAEVRRLTPEIELVQGRWNFIPGSVRSGDTTLEWNGASLANARFAIRHLAGSSPELWSSLPGGGFVAAAREGRLPGYHSGIAAIAARPMALCFRQKVDGIDLADGITIFGRLECSDGETGYRLRFWTASDHRLSLQLRLENSRYNRSYLAFASRVTTGPINGASPPVNKWLPSLLIENHESFFIERTENGRGIVAVSSNELRAGILLERAAGNQAANPGAARPSRSLMN